MIVQVHGALTLTLQEIFDVDNSSSSHSGIRKNNFLILGGGPIFRSNERFCSPLLLI